MSEQVREKRGFVKKIAAAVGTLTVLITGFYGVVGFIDSRIEQKIADDSYMKRLANQLIPSLIFDSTGAVLSDSGALALIEIPFIKKAGGEQDYYYEITITPKVFLSVAPILQPLGGPYVVTEERGEGLKWIYTLERKKYLEFEDSARSSKPERFRLEIIR